MIFHTIQRGHFGGCTPQCSPLTLERHTNMLTKMEAAHNYFTSFRAFGESENNIPLTWASSAFLYSVRRRAGCGDQRTFQ